MRKLLVVIVSLELVFLLTSTQSLFGKSGGGERKRISAIRLDSLFKKPHDLYPQELLKMFPSTHNSFQKGFSPTSISQLHPNINVSQDTSPQNEPSVKISHKNPNRVVAAWRDFRTGVQPAVRRVGYSFSTDGGTSWSTSSLLPSFSSAYPRTSDPAVGVDTAGNFYIATISINSSDGNGKIVVYNSIDQGETFTNATVAPADTSPAFFDDKEYITTDLSPSSPYANRIYISWTRFGSPGGMFLTYSSDAGTTWSPHIVINDPGLSGQGSDPCVRPNGDVCVVWAGGPGIMFDKSTDGGNSFDTDVVVDTTFGSFGGFPSVEADLSSGPRSGYLYTVYSDGRNGDLDVFLKSSSDGGATWSSPVRVNDDSVGNGKNQYWPWIAVDDRGTITVVYYDTRNTPNSTITETYFARSNNGGATFSNELVSTAQSPHNTPNGAVRFGDYIGMDAWGGRAIPVWTDERAGGYNMDIYTAAIDLNRTVASSVKKGWNIVSLPMTVPDPLKTTVFPTAISSAFAYEGTYVPKDTLALGRGYWLKFGSDQDIVFTGDSLNLDTVSVMDGWNLIGSISSSLPVSSIVSDPPSIMTSQFFEYKDGYTISSTILPGHGYWVKANQSGSLILSSSSSLANERRIRIIPTAERPPLPPDGAIAHEERLPQAYYLSQNYPNPFNP
ncbi:MAG: exo-alpha-sialidase, partial [Ignavibacteriales bacterium]|nr:exo-alpha-sialidase [Ignavibacteriales bacterium]